MIFTKELFFIINDLMLLIEPVKYLETFVLLSDVLFAVFRSLFSEICTIFCVFFASVLLSLFMLELELFLLFKEFEPERATGFVAEVVAVPRVVAALCQK